MSSTVNSTHFQLPQIATSQHNRVLTQGNTDSQRCELPRVSSAVQLLNGDVSASSNPRAASAVSLLQANAARSVLGPPQAQEQQNDSPWLSTAGDAAGAAGDGAQAAGRGSRAGAQTAMVLADAAGPASGASRALRFLGPAGMVISTGVEVFTTGAEIRDIVNNPNLTEAQKEQRSGQAALEGGGTVLGGAGGAAAGAAIGAVGGPPGMILGAIIGGLFGSWGGGKAGEAVGSTGAGRTVGKLFA